MSTQSSNLYNSTGIQLPTDAFVVIVCTEWNAETIEKLKLGATQILQDYKVAYQIITVPGAFEIPFAIKNFWQKATTKPHAFIALGCVLRGDTPHFEYVCQGVTQGIMQLNLDLPVPTIYGVLTVNTQQQIEERLGGTHGHKGEEAAMAALKMINLSVSK
ncbi:MAG: 6,7-dimethyl-8-ribityllumazine synthase [Ferruginibacter sp.]|nr:6,7-dimethyl-8-ribityllumazine synthase [Ferruginibacter sp.]